MPPVNTTLFGVKNQEKRKNNKQRWIFARGYANIVLLRKDTLFRKIQHRTENTMKLRNYFGDKVFYKRVLSLTIPIMIQSGITNFVNMLDNIMVGRVGTLPMTGVAVANQLIFVYNICVFGAVSGAGIFVAQFHGKRDTKGVQQTFRFKLLTCLAITLLGLGIFAFGGDMLISQWLKGEGQASDIAAALKYGSDYLKIILWGLIPYAVTQCYSGTLRETDKVLPPMFAGILAVGVNLTLNWVLIFGKLGAPALGANGAAIATVISRYVELAVVVIWTHCNSGKNPFIRGVYRSLYIPAALIRDISVRGLPLMLNEAMWSAGVTFLNQCYSVRSLDVVSATNISSTFFNVFGVAFMSVGSAIGIIVGQYLGAGKSEEAKDAARKMIVFSVLVSIAVGSVFFAAAAYIPNSYNTTESVRCLAKRLMQITAVLMPLDAFAHASYFTIRSGGKVFVTILFDSVYVWVINVPTALLLTHFTGLNVMIVFAIVESEKLIKDIIGGALVRSGIWIHNIVAQEEPAEITDTERKKTSI